jgi:hypothetical protein
MAPHRAKSEGKGDRSMLVKMRRDATAEEVGAVEQKLHALGFKTGKMVGEEITLIGVYGDISKLPGARSRSWPASSS